MSGDVSKFVIDEMNAMLISARHAVLNDREAIPMLAFYRSDRRRFTALLTTHMNEWLPALSEIIQLACVDTLVWMADAYVRDYDVDTAKILGGEAALPSQDPAAHSELVAWATMRVKSTILVTDAVCLPWHIDDDGTRRFDEIRQAEAPVNVPGTFTNVLVSALARPRLHAVDEAITRLRRFGVVMLGNGKTLLPTVSQGEES